MHPDILPRVIFSPGQLALGLCDGLREAGVEVTLFSPGSMDTAALNITADLSLFERELAQRGDDFIDLLKKHPQIFIALARQVQSELLARAFALANAGELDVVHIYTNEEDLALPFSQLCRRPVVFTHHDPFNFLAKYRSVFPKYPQLNWISMSLAQRRGMPPETNWVANIPHGIALEAFKANLKPKGRYLAYLGRIVEPKGLHLAIAAVKAYNSTAAEPYRLKIAGKHYSGAKDEYWTQQIEPQIDGGIIQYEGFIDDPMGKQDFLGNADALLVPSTFDEPFGMVMIEALACGTPVIGLNSGAIPEVVRDGITGFVTPNPATLVSAIRRIGSVDRSACRYDFEQRFTLERMATRHLAVYEQLVSL